MIQEALLATNIVLRMSLIRIIFCFENAMITKQLE